MSLIKPSMIALAILGFGALIAMAYNQNDSPARVSCGANSCGCEPTDEGPLHDMPPVLCDPNRCARHSNHETQLGNQLYCIARNSTCHVKIETVSLGCIDYLRFCRNDDINLCHKGPCTNAEEHMPERCTRPLR